MDSLPVMLLGVPVLNEPEEVVVQELELAIQKARENNFFSTFNSYTFFKLQARDCEQLRNIFRESLGVVTSCNFMIGLSKLLGSPILYKIQSKSIINKLIQKSKGKEKALFYVGEDDRTTKERLVEFHENSPHLRIVGAASPPMSIHGEDLVNSFHRDLLIAEQINEPKPDVLILDLEFPKAEIVFERLKPHIKVPLTIDREHLKSKIGIFEKTFNILKGGFVAIPLILYHNVSRFLYNCTHRSGHGNVSADLMLFLSKKKSMAVLRLPPLLDQMSGLNVLSDVRECENKGAVILDFEKVRHIQPEGISALFQIIQKRNRQLYFLNMHKDIVWLMFFHRVWDALRYFVCDTIDELTARIEGEVFYDAIQQQGDQVTLFFFGSLDNQQDFLVYLQKLAPILSDKSCVLDLSYCSYMDNTAMGFLLNLRKLVSQNGRSFGIRSAKRRVRRLMIQAGVWDLF